jgi:hypothetical protein
MEFGWRGDHLDSEEDGVGIGVERERYGGSSPALRGLPVRHEHLRSNHQL